MPDFEKAILESMDYAQDAESDDIEFADLEDLDVAFEKEEIILIFKGEKSGKQTKILVRHLTPGEIADIENTLLSDRVVNAMIKASPKSAEANALEIEASKELGEKSFEKMVKAVQRGIIKPAGATEEQIANWEPLRIWDIYTAIRPRGVGNNAVDTFHSMDKSAEK